MKKSSLSLLFLLGLFLLFPPLTSAHLSGQPPFFLVNGKYSGFYPVYVTSLKNFLLSQDSAPDNYLINQPLQFEIDQTMLPFPPDVLGKITYAWDFGDGSKTTGTTATHMYTKMGSYLLTITANYGGYSDPNTKPLLQAILINILPNKDYKLPKAIITANGKIVTDPGNTTLSFSTTNVSLSANSSLAGSAPIVSYFWDLGDGESTQQKKLTHTYSDQNQIYIFPMLRVKDSHGFINDTYVQLEKATLTQKTSQSTSIPWAIPLVILLNFVVIGGVIVIIKKH